MELKCYSFKFDVNEVGEQWTRGFYIMADHPVFIYYLQAFFCVCVQTGLVFTHEKEYITGMLAI